MSHTIDIMEGNTRYLPFRIRQKGQRTPWDLSGASSVHLEVERRVQGNDIPLDAIEIVDGVNGNDWENGLVVPAVSVDDVTAVIGTYRAVLTIVINGETISIPETELFINVKDRPGYTPS